MLQDSSELTNRDKLDVEPLSNDFDLIFVNLWAEFAHDYRAHRDELLVLFLTSLALKFDKLEESVEIAVPLRH